MMGDCDGGGVGSGSARRRRERRLRSFLRHERMAVAMALAESTHHSAPRGQKTARAGGGARVELHGQVPEYAPPPEAAGTVYFAMTPEEELGVPAASRPAPMEEVLPQGGARPAPLLEVAGQQGKDARRPSDYCPVFSPAPCKLGRRVVVSGTVEVRRNYDMITAWICEHYDQADDPEQPSSSSGGKRRKKRKRRKKKVPKTHSSSSLRRCMVDQGNMFEYADELPEDTEEKGIRKEEITLKGGIPALSLYGDYTYLYSRSSGKCWLHGRTHRHRYVRRLGYSSRRTGLPLTSAYGHVCYEEKVAQTLSCALSNKTVKALIWLLSDTSRFSGLQLRRVSAICRRIHRMMTLGLLIDDDDEELGDDADGRSRR